MISNVKILQGHEGAVYQIVFDRESNKLFSVGGDGWLVEWSVHESSDGVLLARVPDQVFSLTVTSDFFLLGTFQGNFYVLDRKSKTILLQEKAHQHGIFSIHADTDRFHTFGGDGRVVVWDANTLDKVRDLSLSSKSLRTYAINTERAEMAVGSSDGCIYILSYPEFHLKRELEGAHDPSVFTLKYLDGRLLSGGRDALMKVWEIIPEYRLAETINAHWFAMYDIVCTPEHLVTSSRDKSIRWWNRESLQPVTSVKWGEVDHAHVHSVNTLAYDDKTGVIFSGSDDRTIRMWK